MTHVDEGLIHAWLDGQLSAAEAARVEHLVATDSAWGAAAAQARGELAAASRILRALDAREDEKTRGREGGMPRRAAPSWWQSRGLRAAAGVVLVVGVASAVWQGMPGSDKAAVALESQIAQPTTPATVGGLDQTKVAEERPAAKQADVRPRGEAVRNATSGAPVAQDVQNLAAALLDTAKRGESRDSVATVMEKKVEIVAPPSVVTALPPTTPVVQGAGGAVAGRAGAVGTGVGAGTGTRVTGVGGGRGGRPGDPVLQRAELGFAGAAAKAQLVDPRLQRGCWMQVDSTAVARDRAADARERTADARDRAMPLLRFVAPVVTDVVRADAAQLKVVSSTAPVIGVMSRMLPDSTFAAEWISGDQRVMLAFTVHADTLRGTRRIAAGDIVYMPQPFRAVRTACP